MAKPLNPSAKEYKFTGSSHVTSVASSASPSPSSMGVWYEGTDQGAINREFFFVEAQTQNYRTVLPHGHITYTMYGQVANVSYTSRENKKMPQVTDWNLVQADSAPIYNAMVGFLNGSQ